MSEIRERATEMMPSVVLTLLSMIQALALELVWTRVIESPHLWRGDVETWVGWLQMSVLMLGFAQVWLFYVSIVLRFRWTPQVKDTLVPFAIGLLEFALVETCEPAKIGLWLMLLAATSAVAIVSNQAIFRAARLHPENREFFDRLGRSRWSDFIPAAAVVASLFLFGLWLSWSPDPITSVISLLFSAVFLASQLHLTWRYWHFSFDAPSAGENDPAPSGPADPESLE